MSYVDDTLGEGGALAKAIPGFSPRAGQIEMAHAIDAAFRDGANLLGEAGTGVGKSVAYLVPAIQAAVGDGIGGRKVVVATANIALQEQLHGKDLPRLAEVLPQPFRYALAKGIANYVCLNAYDEAAAEMVLSGTPEERSEFARVSQWVQMETRRGDLSELPFEMRPEMRRRLTVTSEECTGKSCERYDDCYAHRARREWADAHVIVTNYHLLLAHLVVHRASGGEAGILPPFDLLVGDEIHRMADIARDFLGFRVTPGSARWVARQLAGSKGKRPLEPIDADLKRRIDAEAERFGSALRTARRSPDYSARLREPLPDDAWRPLAGMLREAGSLYLQAASQRALPQGKKVEVIKLGVRAQLLADQIGEAAEVGASRPEGAPRRVYFIEEDERRAPALVCKPVSVADDLRAMLFGGSKPAAPAPVGKYVSVDLAGQLADGLEGSLGPSESFEAVSGVDDVPEHARRAVRSVVGVSATLRTGSGFGFVKSELGAESARELVAESPFDMHEQALLVFPEGMPDPKERRAYDEAVARVCAEAVGYSKGRALLLFNSYRALSVAYERVQAEHGHRYRVMRQGEAPRTQLVKAFREDVSSVLLGTESFWSGVDVVGEACSMVLIDKLPFAPPDDPILDAIQEEDPKGWFARYSVPRAVIAWRQGAGRLIRSVMDRGVIVACDPRILGKGYGRSFLRALPEMRVSRRLADVQAFLDASAAVRGPGAPPAAAGRGGPSPGQSVARPHRPAFASGEPSHTGECEVCGSTNASVAEECPGPRRVPTAADVFGRSEAAREVDEGLRAVVGGGRVRRRPRTGG